jgi:PTH1 family peptidyl-tRNA hydrolase
MGVELVVGLGNPGAKYARSRHNIGFRVVDEMAVRHSNAPWFKRPLCTVTTAWLGPRLILAKPSRFMNRSGASVSWALDHLDIEPGQMLVVLDDVDLDLGTLRLRRAGGPGTHNGLRDICNQIGEGFPRLRLGVRGASTWDDLADYVLSEFSVDEAAVADRMIDVAADAVECVVLEEIDLAMSRFNGPIPSA